MLNITFTLYNDDELNLNVNNEKYYKIKITNGIIYLQRIINKLIHLLFNYYDDLSY